MKRVLAFLSLCALLPQLAMTAETWSVPAATLRVDAKIRSRPENPRLGVLAKIPDGGLLPKPWCVPQAYDASGNALETVIVAHDPADAMGVLFAAPENGDDVSIYITPSNKQPQKPKSDLFPSLLLYTRNGKASLEQAKSLNIGYPPAKGACFDSWDWAGCMVNPFGKDDNYVLWFCGAFELEKPEKIWFATVSDEGSEVHIDGKKVCAWPGVHTRAAGAKGQKGAHVELGRGLHRFDYYMFELTGPQEAQLVWKRPGVPTESGLPEMLTGFLRSGDADLTAIVSKDGKRAGAIAYQQGKIENAQSYFWFGKQPINLFVLTPQAISPDVKAFWEFGKNKRSAVPMLSWLVTGEPDDLACPVTLAVENEKGVLRTSRILKSPWTPSAASLDSEGDRLAYRTALWNMIKAVPQGDPCADWSDDFWGLLVELLEPYKSGSLLKEILERAQPSLQKQSAAIRNKLEDAFILSLRLGKKPEAILEWIDKFEKAERNAARKFHWKEERIDALLLDFASPDRAKREVNALKEAASRPEETQRALLRAGDVARALEDADAALAAYQDAEERFRARNKTGLAGGRLTYSGGRKAKAKNTATNDVPEKPIATFKLPAANKADEWKTYTVRNASQYKTIQNFLDQQALPEALQALRDWENESPTGKLEGEWPIAEANVYKAFGDNRRAANALDIYVRNTGMSAQLADAIKLEVECLQSLGETARAKVLAGEFLKKFPGHPFADEMKELAK